MSFSSAFTKQGFLDYIAKQIKDDEVVMITAHHSEISYAKKTDSASVVFNFPVFGFANNNGVSDIFNSKKVSILISDRSIFKKGLLDVVDGVEAEFKDDIPVPVKSKRPQPKGR